MSRSLPVAELRAADLERNDVRWAVGGWNYATTGKVLGAGGTGTSWLVTRWREHDLASPAEPVVAKTFHPDYLRMLVEDEAAQRHHRHNLRVLDALAALTHPNVLSVLMTAELADNHLIVTPLAGEPLLALLVTQSPTARQRAQLLLDAIRGLGALHAAGIVHRDFHLSNIVTLGEPVGPGVSRRAALCDYDLALQPALLADRDATWAQYYGGRVAGAPEYSVAPELLDDVLSEGPIGPQVDVYAIGTALYALFTTRGVYGEVPDLPTLLHRVAEGVVHHGRSRVRYGDDVPFALRPIIDACLERDPADRFVDANAVLHALEAVVPQLPSTPAGARFRLTMGYYHPERKQRQQEVFAQRLDLGVTQEEITRADVALARYGYLVEASLGRVKQHPIFLAQPDARLVESGQFPGDNTYRKIVTAIDVAGRPDGGELVERWLVQYRPVLERVRSGYLTALYQVVHDKPSGQLLLFSEHVAGARFGHELVAHELGLDEALGLGLIVAQQVARLHREGLAHNNVRPESLLLRGLADVGEVRAMLVGLVEPSLAPEARVEDVRHLAGFVHQLVRPSRVDELPRERRQLVTDLREDLGRLAATGTRAPTIGMLLDAIAAGLGLIDGNFELVRVHRGDMGAYADLLVRHRLYHRLFAT